MSVLGEWIKKAEEDYRAAVRLLKHRGKPTYNLVCFCCQQCVEKYLKAFCVSNGIDFEKRHELIYLLGLLLDVDRSLELLRDELQVLNRYAVDIRYPGDFAGRDEAARALRSAKAVRKVMRMKLGARVTKRTSKGK